MADIELKKKALKLLVSNGVLTDEEYDKCVDAICGTGVPSAKASRYVASNSDSVFDDENINVIFKGMSQITNLFYGKGYSLKFIVENKTGYEMSVSAMEISVNGFMVEDDTYIESSVPANRKTVSNCNIFQNKLDDCDVYGINDMETIELRIKYEVEDLDLEYETELLYLEPYES